MLEEETENQSSFYLSFCCRLPYCRSVEQNATILNTVAEERFYHSLFAEVAYDNIAKRSFVNLNGSSSQRIKTWKELTLILRTIIKGEQIEK